MRKSDKLKLLSILSAVAFLLSFGSCGVIPESISVNRSIEAPSTVQSVPTPEPFTSFEYTDESSSVSQTDSSTSDLSSATDSSSESQAESEEQVNTQSTVETVSTESEYNISNPYVTADLDYAEYAYVPNDAVVKYLGRTELADDILWCAMSGTGAEFSYTGKNLEVTFKADSSISDVSNHHARMGIFVNGERVVDEMIDQSEQTFPVIKSDSTATYNVKVIKLSEGEMSTVGIKSINLDGGEDISPAAESSRKIEFIGDSITCGYGVDSASAYESFSTATEDISKTFAMLTADYFGADCNIFAMSGYGILSGWTSNSSKINSTPIIPSYYSKLGLTNASFTGYSLPQSISWDFSRFQPDVIVINLGTNDSTYCGSDEDKLEAFVSAYVSFLKQVRENNPNAEIFCILGTCSKQIYAQVEETVNVYTEETGDTAVHACLLNSGDSSYGYGADYHPSAASHKLMADELCNVISSTLNW